MKRFFYFCAITAFAVNVLSCSKNEESPIPSSVETRTPESFEAQRAANAILVKFMKLDKNDERYYLDISREDASKLGVPEEFYDRAVQDIETTNRGIQWYRENRPDFHLYVPDPSEWISDPTPTTYNAVSSNLPSGTLRTSGQEEASAEFLAPQEMSGVSFFCRANVAMSCFFTCKTYSLGNWQSDTKIGSSLTNTTIDVPLTASNVYASVYFSTTDSNGGTAVYSGY